MRTLWHDVRYAARSLHQTPVFTGLAILVLAIGIGATTAIFVLVDGTVIRPLPFAEPDRLVMLWERPPGFRHNSVSPLNFLDWSEQNHTFLSMAAISGGGRVLTGSSGAAERVPGQAVSFALFDVLGIKPIAGRTFIAADAHAQPNTVVIGERFWRTHLNGAHDAVGRVIRLDGQPFTVIGIVPASFQILYPADIWTPFPPRRTPEQRRQHFLQVVARLKPGTSVDDARTDMSLVAGDIARISPETNKNWGVTIEPLRDGLVSGEVRTTSLVLGGIVVFVLLMACANVANLMLARGVGRRREIAVRAALGGSARQIGRLLLTESLVLAAAGGAAGTGLSGVIVRAAPSIIPRGLLPEGIALQFDARVTIFATALTCVTGVLFGLAPAWHAANTSLTDALTSGGRAFTGGAARLRASLAVWEVAGAVLLLAGAGLFIRTLAAMEAEDPGFRADSVLTMSVSLPLSRYPDQDRVLTFYRRAESALAALPGVRSVGLVENLPLDGWDIGQPVAIAGDPETIESNRKSAHYQMASTRYFETLGIAFAKGRPFNDRDVASSTPVCIVNEEFVRRFMNEHEAIGAIVNVPNMAPGTAPTIAREVVGVIKQVALGAGELEKAPEIYVPIEQNVWYSTAIALRTAGSPMGLAQAARAAIANIDPDQPVTRVRTMDDIVTESTLRPRFRAELVGTFALLALALAAVGLFSVLTFSVGQRMREFGLRIALGAGAEDILRLVLAGGAKIVGAGVAIGFGASAALTRLLASLLFGVTPLDPVTFAAAPAILAMTALLACVAPAVHAIRADPAAMLRQD